MEIEVREVLSETEKEDDIFDDWSKDEEKPISKKKVVSIAVTAACLLILALAIVIFMIIRESKSNALNITAALIVIGVFVLDIVVLIKNYNSLTYYELYNKNLKNRGKDITVKNFKYSSESVGAFLEANRFEWENGVYVLRQFTANGTKIYGVYIDKGENFKECCKDFLNNKSDKLFGKDNAQTVKYYLYFTEDFTDEDKTAYRNLALNEMAVLSIQGMFSDAVIPLIVCGGKIYFYELGAPLDMNQFCCGTRKIKKMLDKDK